MNIRLLLSKLSVERQQLFIRNPVWQEAAKRGLSWAEAAGDKRAVHAASLQLPEYAAVVLREMLRLFAAEPVEGEKLLNDIRRNTLLSGAECQLGLKELEEAGILFSVRKVWGESLYFMPADCFCLWQQALMPFEPKPLSESGRDKLMRGTMTPRYRSFGRQLLSAMASLAGSGLELTAKGALPKKTIAKLVQAVELEEERLIPFGLNWPLREHYPLKAAFILEACSALELLEMEEGSLKWNEPKLHKWLRLNEAERELQLLNWCLTLLLPAGASSAHAGAALIGTEEGKWFSERDVQAWLEAVRIEITPGDSQARDKSARLWYGLLHSLGWLEWVDYAHSGEQERFIRLKLPHSSPKETRGEESANKRFINVQPNGEILAAPDCPFTVRWELELVAERISEEQMAVYRLEASTVARALENGRTRQTIRRTLEAASGEALPIAVEALLETWTNRACRSEFAEVVLLRCDNDQMAHIAENHPGVKALLLEKLGAIDFIVDKSNLNEIRRLLQQAGYPPRKGVQATGTSVIQRYPTFHCPGTDEEIGPPMGEEKGMKTAYPFIYEPFPLRHFELTENAGGENILIVSQLKRVPAMWTKQLRAYHHSTRKELIEQALEWQTPVELRMKRGLRSFVPEKLEQTDGSWAVIGLLRDERERELIRLTPDMWEEMRLIIPGRADPI
ncbi:helicase-associated domain-containing protein [Paenibacillus harenae]|uniref:helicase-associated domain-containing protein n=1 Tax=Paenibacillus harenae TaxID=306543 RepID=UPI0003F8CF15|nr:helicase-associated domain-containing protein [Paenibacillus harenae]